MENTRGMVDGTMPFFVYVPCFTKENLFDFEDLPYAQMGESKSLVKNQPCLSISYPSGQRARLAPVVRFGHLVRDGGGTKMLQSTALMEPGDSGGPLFDLNGRVVGIHSRTSNVPQ